MEFKANYSQKKFLNLKQKYRALVAGFGAGKTFGGCVSQLLHYHQHPQVRQGYFGCTYPEIRDVFYPTMEEAAHMFGLQVKINEGNKEIHFSRGPWYYGTTICRSMSEPGTIKGFKIGRALVDEIDTLPLRKALDAWRRIIARLRIKSGTVENGADVTCTPEGFKFLYKMFVVDLERHPDLKKLYGMVSASTFDNVKNLPPDYISSLVSTYPLELIAAYINGEFVNLESGTVYYSFDRKVHDSKEVATDTDVLHVGMDFNIKQMAARIFVERVDGDHLVAELSDIYDTRAMIEALKARYRNHTINVYPDATGKDIRSTSATESDFALLEAAGFHIFANPSNPRVKDRVNAVNKRFQLGKLWVNVTRCPRSTADLEQQAWDKAKGEPDKKHGQDHGNDAIGYCQSYRYPVVKPAYDLTVKYN